MNDTPNEQKIEMPKYTCNKQVHALQIHDLVGNYVVPENGNIPKFMVPDDWFEQYNPQPGGYLIVHDDGMRSYLSKEAFEGWYTSNSDLVGLLTLLCVVHTRYEPDTGTAVALGAIPEYDHGSRYIEAWMNIRQMAGLPVHPVTEDTAE